MSRVFFEVCLVTYAIFLLSGLILKVSSSHEELSICPMNFSENFLLGDFEHAVRPMQSRETVK